MGCGSLIRKAVFHVAFHIAFRLAFRVAASANIQSPHRPSWCQICCARNRPLHRPLGDRARLEQALLHRDRARYGQGVVLRGNDRAAGSIPIPGRNAGVLDRRRAGLRSGRQKARAIRGARPYRSARRPNQPLGRGSRAAIPLLGLPRPAGKRSRAELRPARCPISRGTTGLRPAPMPQPGAAGTTLFGQQILAKRRVTTNFRSIPGVGGATILV